MADTTNAPEDTLEYWKNLASELMEEQAILKGETAAQADFKAEVEKLKVERNELVERIKELEGNAASDLKADLEKAQADAQDALDKFARIQADWENFRKRTARERIEERERACEQLISQLLPVLDDLERALNHAAQEAPHNEGLKTFSEGIKAVQNKMVDTLAKEGVSEVGASGEPFDPVAHKAVGRVEDASQFEDTVHDVYQKGYRIGNKIIREAMVTVSYGGPTRPKEEQENDTKDSTSESDTSQN